MARLDPRERWSRLVLERYAAFKQSGEFEKLRAEGLKILKRKKLFTAEEWVQTFHQRMNSPEYRTWHDKCKTVGERFGIAQHIMAIACLLKGFKPEHSPFVLESRWPQIRLVTESSDPVFITRLAYEAQKLGTGVIQRQGSIENIYLFFNQVPIDWIEPPPIPLTMPPLTHAFYTRVESPPGYPPEAAQALQKKAGSLEREILTRLGYSVPQRTRSSSFINLAGRLEVSKAKLPRRRLFEIVSNIWPDDRSTATLDEKRRKLLQSRRHKLRKRLIKPYRGNSDKP